MFTCAASPVPNADSGRLGVASFTAMAVQIALFGAHCSAWEGRGAASWGSSLCGLDDGQ